MTPTLRYVKEREKLISYTDGIIPSPYITVRRTAKIGSCAGTVLPSSAYSAEIKYQIEKGKQTANRDCILLLDKISLKPITGYVALKPKITEISENHFIIEVSMGFSCV